MVTINRNGLTLRYWRDRKGFYINIAKGSEPVGSLTFGNDDSGATTALMFGKLIKQLLAAEEPPVMISEVDVRSEERWVVVLLYLYNSSTPYLLTMGPENFPLRKQELLDFFRELKDHFRFKMLD